MKDFHLSARRRALMLVLAAAAVAAACVPAISLGDLHQSLSTSTATATRLQAQIAAESKRIAATQAGVEQARRRLAGLDAQVAVRQAQLATVQRSLVAARARLTRLVNRFHDATRALSANLVAAYEDSTPDVVTIALEAHGFNDFLEQLKFMERVQRRNARILADTKTAKTRVLHQAQRLDALEAHMRSLAEAVQQARDGAAAIQAALLDRQAQQLQRRATTAGALTRVRGQIRGLRARIAQIAAQARARRVAAAAPHPSPAPQSVPGIAVDPGGMASAPAGAPAAVRQVIAAGNAIAGLPYLYGGGHGSFHANAYDCSGSVSYALAAAGLVSSPLDSTAFESWGEAGAGRWITVYANAGHAFMVVAGWRFDTGALSSGGTRWSRAMRSTAGFVARHPSGL